MTTDPFDQLERQLRRADRRAGESPLGRWAAQCALIAEAALPGVAAVPAWVWSLGSGEADEVLDALVGCAQGGDSHATMAVVACLRPGLRRVARRYGVDWCEVMSVAAVQVLRGPRRRRVVAAGLVLDVGRVFWRAAQRAGAEVPTGRESLARLAGPAPGELGVEVSAADELVALVREARHFGHLDSEDARLVIESRVLGLRGEDIAERREVTRWVADRRRRAAEARLAAAAA